MTANDGRGRLLRTYGWLILLMTVVVTAGAYVWSRLEPAEYRAAATVVIAPRLRVNITPPPADPGAEREIARSAAVLRPAATELSISRAELTDGLRVDPVADGAALTIAYVDRDPATAQRRAQTVAERYVAYRNQSAAQTGLAAVLVTPAVDAERRYRPLRPVLGAGAAAGLLLGLGSAALLRSRTRDRIRGRAHFEELTGLPVLATIPRARRSRGPGAPLPVLLRSADSADAESYRYLRARLEPLLDGPATVLVTSARDGEGRSTTAANLAVALAQAGRDVVLVDADVRSPQVHQMFDLPREPGLTGVLAGTATGDRALVDGPIPHLRVLTAGGDRNGAGDLLAGTGLAEMLRELKTHHDVVVLDSAPLLSVADAVALATLSDRVLLVSDYGSATLGPVARAAVELKQVAPGRVGAVLIGVPERAGGLVPRTRTGRAPAPAAPATTPGDRFAVLEGPNEEQLAAPRAAVAAAPVPQPEARPEPTSGSPLGARPALRPGGQSAPQAAAAAQRDPRSAPAFDSRSTPQFGSTSAPQRDARSTQQPDARSGSQAEVRSAPHADAPRPDPRSGRQADAASAPQAEVRSGPQGDARSAPQADARPQGDARPGPQADARPAPQPDARPGLQPDARPGPQPDARPAPQPDARSAAEGDARPGPQADARSAPRAEAGPGQQPADVAVPKPLSPPPPPITAKAAVPKPRVYTSAAKAKAEAEAQAKRGDDAAAVPGARDDS